MTLDFKSLEAIPAANFVAAVGPLFEHAPGFLYRLAAARPFRPRARPFRARARLFARAREIAHSMPEELQVELIDAHPRIGAAPELVSAMSFREQGYDREAVANLTNEGARERDRVAAELGRLNCEYEARFGFRYCVFVAGRSRAELLPEMAASLERERYAELHRALDAVVDIAEARSRA